MTPENKPKGEIITSKQGQYFATEQGSGRDTVVKFYEGPCDQDVGEAYVPCTPEPKLEVAVRTFIKESKIDPDAALERYKATVDGLGFGVIVIDAAKSHRQQ